MRKPRNANRGTIESLHDAFCDLDVSAQARMLETLAGLHRQAQRMQRKKEPEPIAAASFTLEPSFMAAIATPEEQGL